LQFTIGVIVNITQKITVGDRILNHKAFLVKTRELLLVVVFFHEQNKTQFELQPLKQMSPMLFWYSMQYSVLISMILVCLWVGTWDKRALWRRFKVITLGACASGACASGTCSSVLAIESLLALTLTRMQRNKGKEEESTTRIEVYKGNNTTNLIQPKYAHFLLKMVILLENDTQ
jgi:hypothetical protein